MSDNHIFTINWNEILPQEMSDEAAYHLVSFIINLGTKLEKNYYGQIMQYAEDWILPGAKEIFTSPFDEENK